MEHMKRHVKLGDDQMTGSIVQCEYCLETFADTNQLKKHATLRHPLSTRSNGFSCIICEVWSALRCFPMNRVSFIHDQLQQLRFSSNTVLANHMRRTHVVLDLPYRCGSCSHASSSLRHTIDHFYTDHAKSGTLQCPLCLQVRGMTRAAHINTTLTATIYFCSRIL